MQELKIDIDKVDVKLVTNTEFGVYEMYNGGLMFTPNIVNMTKYMYSQLKQLGFDENRIYTSIVNYDDCHGEMEVDITDDEEIEISEINMTIISDSDTLNNIFEFIASEIRATNKMDGIQEIVFTIEEYEDGDRAENYEESVIFSYIPYKSVELL